MEKDKLNIGILIGGRSVEHDISILSGLQVYHAIDKDKYNVYLFYLDKNYNFYFDDALNKIDTYKDETYKKLPKITFYNKDQKVCFEGIDKRKIKGVIDIFIPVVHGEGVEDGTITGYLDTLGAVYTASDLTSSSIAQDKIYSKIILEKEKINVVPYIGITLDRITEKLLDNINSDLQYPLIIKPARLGSSIGITTVYNKDDLEDKLKKAKKYGSRILIEEKIENFKEYNIAIVREGTNLITSSIEEVIKTDEILSFNDKYEKNQKYEENNHRIIPATLPPHLENEIRNISLKAYNALNMNGVVRIDTIYDTENEILYLNEINTIPGSLSFYLFDVAHISFTKLIDILIRNAIINKTLNQNIIRTFNSNVLNKKSLKLTK